MNEAIKRWLNKDLSKPSKRNTYICVQSSCDVGDGMTFNEKAEHIFKQLGYDNVRNNVQDVPRRVQDGGKDSE